nr:MAG TPA: Ribosome associated membrane protein RAMP4 [Caudoviricetes sp.]
MGNHYKIIGGSEMSFVWVMFVFFGGVVCGSMINDR